MKKLSARTQFYSKNKEVSSLLYAKVLNMKGTWNPLDVCVIMDITKSMDPYIDKMKVVINSLFDDIKKNTGVAPRISCIGFRDKKDGENQISSIDFTDKIEEVKKFVNNIKCDGGDDTCEDLIAPLKKCLELNWKSDFKYVYLLLEAPAHGKRYHPKGKPIYDYIRDDYPNDDDDLMLEKLICHYRNCKVCLIIIQCHYQTTETVKIIKEYYETANRKLKVIDFPLDEVKDPKLSPKIIERFSSSLTKTFNKTKIEDSKAVKPRPSMEIPLGIDNDALEKQFKGTIYSGEVKDLNCSEIFKAIGNNDTIKAEFPYKISIKQSFTRTFQIIHDKIGAGSFSECYYMRTINEASDKSEYVAKIPKRKIRDYKELADDIEASVITTYFVGKFNTAFGKQLLYTKPLAIIEINEETKLTNNGKKAFLAQQFIPGEYTKYNNNFGWVNVGNRTVGQELAQAFSHFTYEYSIGALIIVDIQGCYQEEEKKGEILYITDPSINSPKYPQKFGLTNLGNLGVWKFFGTHRCNKYCEALKLTSQALENEAEYGLIMAKYKDEPILSHLYSKICLPMNSEMNELKDFDERRMPISKAYEPPEPESSSVSRPNTGNFDLEI